MAGRDLEVSCTVSTKRLEDKNFRQAIQSFDSWMIGDLSFPNLDRGLVYRDVTDKPLKAHTIFHRRENWEPYTDFEKKRKKGIYSYSDGRNFVKKLISLKLESLPFCKSWFLFNECFSSTGLIPVGLYNIWGPNYIEEILDYCRKEYPSYLFYLNEYGIQNIDIFKQLLKHSSKLDFDGLGVQVYTPINSVISSKIEKNLIYISQNWNKQIDISEFNIFTPIRLDPLQRLYYQKLIDTFKKIESIKSMNYWWVSDQHCRPNWIKSRTYGGILDDEYKRKFKLIY